MEHYRIRDDAVLYFVTFSIVDWLPVFISEQSCRIVTESFRFCHEQKHLRINAFVIMPTHLHAIVFDRDFDSARLSKTLTEVRKFTGRTLADYCEGHLPKCFRETLHAAAGDDRERRFWQPNRHPEALTSEAFWRQKLDYLHANPCRKGLVIRPENWRYSSAGFLLTDGALPCDVPLTPVIW